MVITINEVKKQGLPTILYGAGRQAKKALAIIRQHGVDPVCFCDKNSNLWGSRVDGVEVVGLEEAKRRYPEGCFYLTMMEPLRAEVFKEFHASDHNRIVLLKPSSWRKSCSLLEHELIFADDGLYACCLNGNAKTKSVNFSFSGDLNADILNYLKHKAKIREANQDKKKNTPCTGCKFLVESFWPDDVKGFSSLMFGKNTICQLHCIYCGVLPDNPEKHPIAIDEGEFLDVLRKNHLIDELNFVTIASGEIAVHPGKDAILDGTYGTPCMILSNGVLYDEKIARNLLVPDSSLLLSLDSGTGETYITVKGCDVFDRVVENIKRYRDNGVNVVLKYIVLPENNNEKDFDGFCDICQSANIQTSIVDVDCRDTYLTRPVEILEGVVDLANRLRNASVVCQIAKTSLSPGDIKRIERMMSCG